MPTVATYLRSATDEPAAFAGHQALLDAWLTEHPEHTLVGAFTDTCCRRTSPLASRRGFSALLAQVAAQKVDVVLVPASCVISSDPVDRRAVLAQLRAQGMTILTTDGPLDRPGDELLYRSITEAINAFRLDQQRQSAAHARACKAQKRALRQQSA